MRSDRVGFLLSFRIVDSLFAVSADGDVLFVLAIAMLDFSDFLSDFVSGENLRFGYHGLDILIGEQRNCLI